MAKLTASQSTAQSQQAAAHRAHIDAPAFLAGCPGVEPTFALVRDFGEAIGYTGRDLEVYVERFVGHVVNVRAGSRGV